MAYLVGGGGQPIMVLKEGTDRKTKKDAFSNNVAAALAISEAVKSTLGPKGLDKLLVDGMGDITITNDGATILKDIGVDHPTAKIMVEVAKTQDDEIGDGTTTSVIIAGSILSNLSDLIQGGVHPTIVAKGISKAKEKALEILDEIAYKLSDSDKELMKKVIATSMNSKVISLGKNFLAGLVLEAILGLKNAGVKNLNKNVSKIKIVKKEGGTIDDTKLVKGIVLDKEIVHSQMPTLVKDPKIALLGFALEVKKGEWDGKISIKNPDQIQSFLDEEERMIETKVQQLVDMGVTSILSHKSMDDKAIHFLKKAGILAVKGISESDLKLVAEAVGGKILNSLEEMMENDLGTCGKIEARKVGNSKFLFIEECENPQAMTILIRGEGAKLLEEVDRGLHDALCVAATLVQEMAIVGCGGAAEIELTKRLKAYAKTFSGREQLVVDFFAESLQIIPITLVENAGLDAMDVIGDLNAAHKTDADVFKGYNLFTNKIEDMKDAGIMEPVGLVKTAIKTAAEAAMMIVRIDDIIRAGNLSG
ncbi:MAG: thermosome subunit beta [Candidatus Hodarchaeota archaeon]